MHCSQMLRNMFVSSLSNLKKGVGPQEINEYYGL